MISIITVSLNSGKLLEDTVHSVLKQTSSSWELIIIDGGSTDDSLNFLQNLHNDNIKFYSVSDNGIYDAMNIGLGYVKGKIINFLNCGDYYIDSNLLDEILLENKNQPHLLYVSRLQNNIPNRIHKKFTIGNLCHQSIFYNLDLLGVFRFNTNYKLCADFDLTLKIFYKTKYFNKILFLNGTIFYDFSGISSRKIKNRLLEKQSIIAKNLPFFLFRGTLSILIIKFKLWIKL